MFSYSESTFHQNKAFTHLDYSSEYTTFIALYIVGSLAVLAGKPTMFVYLLSDKKHRLFSSPNYSKFQIKCLSLEKSNE